MNAIHAVFQEITALLRGVMYPYPLHSLFIITTALNGPEKLGWITRSRG
jgi:hypothetical protein